MSQQGDDKQPDSTTDTEDTMETFECKKCGKFRCDGTCESSTVATFAAAERMRKFVTEGEYDGTEQEFNADIIALCDKAQGK